MEARRETGRSNLTRTLAERACAVTYEALARGGARLARQCVLDYFGVGACRRRRPAGAHPARRDDRGRRRRAGRVIGHRTRLPVLAAALVNGAIAHALDYDDVNLAMPGHPSVAILPALLALAEAAQASGSAVIAAFVAGYETCCRLGTALRPGHYTLGFHATGTVGAFGAAAACAHLLGLDAEATGLRARHRRHAIGRPQVAIRHDVQAVPRRQGGAERAARRPARGARVFQPPRPDRMHPRLRRDPRARFLPREGAGRARSTAFTSSTTSSSITPPAT